MLKNNIKKQLDDGIKNEAIILYSDENKHLFTYEDLELFKKIEQGQIISSKYWRIQKQMILEKTKSAFHTTPKTSIKKVIMDILNPLPDFLPASNVLEVTTYIVEEWMRLEQAIVAKNKTLIKTEKIS